jgi:hypothetical protein
MDIAENGRKGHMRMVGWMRGVDGWMDIQESGRKCAHADGWVDGWTYRRVYRPPVLMATLGWVATMCYPTWEQC